MLWNGRGALLALMLVALAGCESADERAQRHLERGEELLAEGDTVKATLEFRNALQLNENLVGAHLGLGGIYREEQNYGPAVDHYRRALELAADNAEAPLRLGQIMLLANQLDEALKYSTNAFQLAPRDAEVLGLKSAVAYRLGNWDTAEDAALGALAANPAASDARMVLAAIDIANDDPEGALAELSAAEERDPGNTLVGVLQIRVLALLDRQAEVRAVLQRMVDRNPDAPQFREALATWHLEQGDTASAEAEFRALADREPVDTEQILTLIRFLAGTRGQDAALTELEARSAAATDADVKFRLESALAGAEIAAGTPELAVDRIRATIDETTSDEVARSARVLLAQILLAQDDEGGAAELIEEVLADDADNVAARVERGRMRLGDGAVDEAIQDLRAALTEAPNNAEILMLLADAHRLAGNTDLAGERLASAVQVSEAATQPVLAYAQHFLGRDRADLAEQVVEEALRRNPQDATLLEALVRVRLANGDSAGAEEASTRLKAVAPAGGAERADQLLAAALVGQNRFDEGIQLLEELNGRDATGQSSMAQLVETYVRAGQAENARDFLDRVLAENPQNTEAHLLRAALHLRDDNASAAVANYEAAIAADPRNTSAYQELAQYYARTGEYGAAEAVLRQGIDAAAVPDALRLLLAGVKELRGEIPDAIAEYEQLYAREPDNYVIANNLASLLADFDPTPENLERAYQIARRLRGSDVPAFQDTYGWIQFQRGEYNDALAALIPAAEALPNNLLVQYHVGMAYAEAGQMEEARVALERALTLGEASEAQLPQLDTARARLQALDAAPETQ
ncbi:MAG: tetratricopeptide repeat protein [Pseudomonadota bacterium]